MSSTLGASLLRTVLSDGTLKILGSGLDKGPIIPFQDGEFEDSELGRIPKGWRVGTIQELISDTLGGDWGKETEQGNYTEEVICIRGADIPEIAIGKKGNPPTRYILKKNLDKKELSAGQIIIEISGGAYFCR